MASLPNCSQTATGEAQVNLYNFYSNFVFEIIMGVASRLLVRVGFVTFLFVLHTFCFPVIPLLFCTARFFYKGFPACVCFVGGLTAEWNHGKGRRPRGRMFMFWATVPQ